MGKQMTVMVSLVSIITLLFVVGDSGRISTPENDITCEDALKKLMPCQPFLRGSDPPTPSVGCCEGASYVYNLANTTQIRQSLCECFKRAAVQFGILPDRAKKIPELCHIPLDIPIDPSVDCTKISF